MAQTYSIFADHVVLPQSHPDISESVVVPNLQITSACLQISSSTIVSVTPMSRQQWEKTPVEPTEQRLDLGHRLITPAFINAHTHLPMVVFRGLANSSQAMARNVVEDLYFRVEHRLDPGDVRAFARLGAYENLLHGVGTVWDHYYAGVSVAEALLETGLTGVIAPTLQDLSGPGVAQQENQWQATVDIHESQRYADHGIVAAWGPHATDTVSDQLWQRVAQAAETYQLPIHAHVAQSIEEYTWSLKKHQQTPIQRLQRLHVLDQAPHMLLVHGIYIDRQDLKRLHPDTHTLGFCPYSQAQYAFPAHTIHWTNTPIPWLVATDCSACNDSMNVQKEMRFVHSMRVIGTTWSQEYDLFAQDGTIEHALNTQQHRTRSFQETELLGDPQFLLSRVWSVPGRMHPKLAVGCLAPGFRANLVVWDPHHPAMWPCLDPLRALALGDTTAAIYHMMVNGQWIGEPGNFAHSLCQQDKYQDALLEANQRLAAVQKRI